MALVARTFSWRPNPDGTVDGHFPLGDKDPTPATASWNETALDALRALVAQRTTGSTFTHDLAQYATGSGLGTATYSVVSVSGTALAGIYATSSANLTSPGSLTGAGFFRLGITVSGDTVYSDPIAWAWAASVVDVLAPTVPTGLSGVSEVGQVTLSWDASTDPPDGAIAASGVDHYDVRLGSTVVATATPAGGFNQPATTYNVSTGSSPAANVVRTGADYAITAEGVFDVTADRGILVGWILSGDFSLSGQLFSLTSPAANSRMGFGVRESLAAGARALYFYYRYSATVPSFRTTIRATADGSTTNPSVITTGVSLPADFRLERVGNTFNTYVNGSLATNQTLALPAQLYVSLINASQSAGVSQTATIKGVAVSLAQQITTTHVTAVGGAYSVRAVDVATNASAYSAPITVVPQGTAALIKFHPGYYIYPGTSWVVPPDSFFDEIAALKITSGADVVGIKVNFLWGQLETGSGAFDWSMVDSILAKAQARGLRVILAVGDRTFGSGGQTLIMPADMQGNATYGGGYFQKLSSTGQATAGRIARSWLAAVMDRKMAFVAELAERYDGHDYFEMFRGEETSISFGPTTPSDYSASLYNAALIRFIREAPLLFPHTSVYLQSNYTNTQTVMETLMAEAELNRCAMGGPDLYPSPHAPSWSDQVLLGNRWSGSAFVAGGIDYTGDILYDNQVQDPEMGGKEGNFTPAQFHARAQVLGQSYLIVSKKNYAWANMPANQQTYWDSSSAASDTYRWKAFLSLGGHELNTTPPAYYNSSVTGAALSGGVLTINGSGFGSKSTPAPHRFFDLAGDSLTTQATAIAGLDSSGGAIAMEQYNADGAVPRAYVTTSDPPDGAKALVTTFTVPGSNGGWTPAMGSFLPNGTTQCYASGWYKFSHDGATLSARPQWKANRAGVYGSGTHSDGNDNYNASGVKLHAEHYAMGDGSMTSGAAFDTNFNDSGNTGHDFSNGAANEVTGWSQFRGGYNMFDQWHFWETWYDTGTIAGSDGALYWWCDGALVGKLTGKAIRLSGSTANPIQHYQFLTGLQLLDPRTYTMSVARMYLDTTRAHASLINASTYAARTGEISVRPTTWNDGQIIAPNVPTVSGYDWVQVTDSAGTTQVFAL